MSKTILKKRKSEGGSLPGVCQNLSGTRQADR